MLRPASLAALSLSVLTFGCSGADGDGAGGASATGGVGNAGTGGTGNAGTGATGGGDAGAPATGGVSGGPRFPFPYGDVGERCGSPAGLDHTLVRAAYDAWKTATVTADGAGGFLRVRKPDSGTVIGSTVSEGIGYGMILAAYFAERDVFDGLWGYAQLYLNDHGLMDWEIDPSGAVIGTGAATDGDEDIAWALLMASRQWGEPAGADAYHLAAVQMIENILAFEVDLTRRSMLKPGDAWGAVDVTNPSYFAPAYFRVFGAVTGKEAEWNAVIDENYAILERSLNATSGNATNGLVPAWCDSAGTPVEAYAGAPLHFQNDSTRTPFRVGQDYCWFGEPRAKAYLDKIASFYAGVGVAQIVDGYELDGTPRPERAVGGLQAASFVGPAGVAFASDPGWQAELDQAWALVATGELTAGTTYYQKSWTALSLLFMAGDFAVLPLPVSP